MQRQSHTFVFTSVSFEIPVLIKIQNIVKIAMKWCNLAHGIPTLGAAFVAYFCSNKLSQALWLQTIEIFGFTVLA